MFPNTSRDYTKCWTHLYSEEEEFIRQLFLKDRPPTLEAFRVLLHRAITEHWIMRWKGEYGKQNAIESKLLIDLVDGYAAVVFVSSGV